MKTIAFAALVYSIIRTLSVLIKAQKMITIPMSDFWEQKRDYAQSMIDRTTGATAFNPELEVLLLKGLGVLVFVMDACLVVYVYTTIKFFIH